MSGYIFSGQGSQKKGMGSGLFEQYPILIKEADEILGYSVEELCLTDPNNLLNLTQYTQPAVFIVNALTYLEYQKKNPVNPEFYAGHSLGEYNALYAAGVFDWKTGIQLVKKRGELMGKSSSSGMAAVIGLSCSDIEEIIKKNNLTQVDVANYNTPQQTVISAPKDIINEIQHYFEEAGARYVILNVSAGFHSRYMDQARVEFEEYIKNIELKQPTVPVIANLTARPYKYKNMKETLLDQINHSVQWTDSIRYMMGKGVEDIVNVGYGTEARSMVRQIKRLAEPLIVEESEEIESNSVITAQTLGSEKFRNYFGVKYAYTVGSMYKAISGVDLVKKMANSGFLAFYGTGGVSNEQLQKDLSQLKEEVSNDKIFGVNMLYQEGNSDKEKVLVDIVLRSGIKIVEASAYLMITQELIRYRLQGIHKNEYGEPCVKNKLIAKVSRPEIAKLFLAAPPAAQVEKLRVEGVITGEEAALAPYIRMADAITVEGDSGGHTDGASLLSLLPTLIRLRDEQQKENSQYVFIGAAGGIGTPESAATAFMLGADYIQTGSINQCTVEASTSETVKNMLQSMNVQDTEHTPCGDLFEFGGKIQVLKKGVFFPARAKKLYELYSFYNSLEEIPANMRTQLEEKYFKKTIDAVLQEAKEHYRSKGIDMESFSTKKQMACVFKLYFSYSTALALKGDDKNKVNFQIHCGPALGAFNQWVKGTRLEDWRNRHVDEIGVELMESTASYITRWIENL
nr:ACP S-malonyltransferase [uncultured Lachnoclostridium sp.]